MAWKEIKQTTLADAFMVNHAAVKELDEGHDLLDWDRIEGLLKEIHNKRQGEKAWPPLMMFKALLLQSWYGLSDPELKKQLARDLLFRRFVKLSLSEPAPDHSSLWRFRQLLSELGLLEALLEEVNDPLTAQRLIIKSGEVRIIDASVIEEKQSRPRKGKDGNNTQDPEADYNVKAGSDGKRQTTYGYKAHMNVEEDGFIKDYDYTVGNVHDSTMFESLLAGEEAEVYADSAYKSQAHDELLKSKHIRNRLLERAYRNTPLTAEQKQRNRINSGTRSIVERVFGLLKLHYRMSKARYMGKARNRTRFGLMCIAYNLKRGLTIHRSCYG